MDSARKGRKVHTSDANSLLTSPIGFAVFFVALWCSVCFVIEKFMPTSLIHRIGIAAQSVKSKTS